MMRLTSRSLLLGLLAVFASLVRVWTQDDWNCSETLCVKRTAQIIAKLDGAFAPGMGLSPDKDADVLAALEQQRWREFRFDVAQTTRIHVQVSFELNPVNGDWPEDRPIPEESARVTLHVPQDGETYSPLQSDELVQAGDFVSLLLSQKSETDDAGGIWFYPSQWSLVLSARQTVSPLERDRVSDTATLLGPTVVGRALGCAALGCGEQALGADSSVSVDGEALVKSTPPCKRYVNRDSCLA